MSGLAKRWLDCARGSTLMFLGRLLRDDGVACRGERKRLDALRGARHRGSVDESEGAFDVSAVIHPEATSDLPPLSRRTS